MCKAMLELMNTLHDEPPAQMLLHGSHSVIMFHSKHSHVSILSSQLSVLFTNN